MAYAKILLTANNYEYIRLEKTSKGYNVACLAKYASWEDAMEWGASVADAMKYKDKIKLHELMTGILDGVAYSIAEDVKIEKKKKEGEKA